MNYALIVAGGVGKRMNSSMPKQFIELESQPILYYTIKKFLEFDASLQIILVLPTSYIHENNFINNYFPEAKNIQMVAGGETRFHSVQNGLNAIHDDGIVFIHDAVRPFVSKNVLENCLKTTCQFGNAIPCIGIKDSLRHITSKGNHAISRNEYRITQTPQTFSIAEIKKAFEQEYNDHFTDEASVFEKAGHLIHLIEGNEENIKITTPFDLQIAKVILQKAMSDKAIANS